MIVFCFWRFFQITNISEDVEETGTLVHYLWAQKYATVTISVSKIILKETVIEVSASLISTSPAEIVIKSRWYRDRLMGIN